MAQFDHLILSAMALCIPMLPFLSTPECEFIKKWEREQRENEEKTEDDRPDDIIGDRKIERRG
jgi:hypothetical protein